MNVIFAYFATATATATDTERWKLGISVFSYILCGLIDTVVLGDLEYSFKLGVLWSRCGCFY